MADAAAPLTPTVYRRSALSVVKWLATHLFGLVFGVFTLALAWAAAVIAGGGGSPPPGNELLTRALAGLVAPGFAAVGSFLILYSLISLYVLARERWAGFVTLAEDHFSTPSYFGARLPYAAIEDAAVLKDRVLPGITTTFPVIILDAVRCPKPAFSVVDRFCAAVFRIYAGWYARRGHRRFRQSLGQPGRFAVSLLTDPDSLDDHALIAAVRARAWPGQG